MLLFSYSGFQSPRGLSNLIATNKKVNIPLSNLNQQKTLVHHQPRKKVKMAFNCLFVQRNIKILRKRENDRECGKISKTKYNSVKCAKLCTIDTVVTVALS